jgi:hypothetical protein
VTIWTRTWRSVFEQDRFHEPGDHDQVTKKDGAWAAAVTPRCGVVSFRASRSSEKHRDKEVILHGVLGYLHARLVGAGGRARSVVGTQAGQGTVEYVALVLLVALVMFGVVAAMKTYKYDGGQELGDLIVNKIKEAVSKVKY